MSIYGFIIALGISSASSTQPAHDVVAEVANLRFYSAFWPNLHHTLYVAAWDRRASGRRLAGTFPEPLTGDLTPDERAAWDAAVAYYDRELASLDLLFANRMAGPIRRAMIEAGDTPGGGLEAAHREALDAAAPVYRKYWWPMHDRANRAWIADVVPRTKEVAEDVTVRLAALYQTPWFTEPVRVDIVRAGNWQGAYTLNRPTHVTIASGDTDAAGWNGVDIVFHEVSHTLILRIQQMIEAEARTAGKQPGTLWHGRGRSRSARRAQDRLHVVRLPNGPDRSRVEHVQAAARARVDAVHSRKDLTRGRCQASRVSHLTCRGA
jgi:hypothetical protein